MPGDTEPTESWTYRNCECRCYSILDGRILGYVRIGDEWVDVLDTDTEPNDPQSLIEEEVDKVLDAALDYDRDDGLSREPYLPSDPSPDPIDPKPFPDTDPYPPDPDPNPMWRDHTRVWQQDGSVIDLVDDDGDCVRMGLSKLDVGDIDDNGRYVG